MVSTGSEAVVILLATRDGERYLNDQLESIAAQSFTSWRLLVSDDGSTDRTLDIIGDFAAAHPGRVDVLDGDPVHSARDNFFRLLSAAPDADYYALCDQDDVWHVDKLRALVAECRQHDGTAGRPRPCLVYSDLEVVDAELGQLDGSFMRQIRVHPERVTFGSLLVENLAPGCAMLFNQSLLAEFRRGSDSLDGAIMHDWWLALLAESTGALVYLDASLIQYRQHSRNARGSVRRTGVRFVLGKILTRNRAAESTMRQAQAFAEATGARLKPECANVLAAYCTLALHGKSARVRTCIRFGILKQTFPRRLYQLLTV